MKINQRALSNLPTIPTVAFRLLDVLGNPEAPISEIVDIIKADPAIAAKLLKAANSPFYGRAKIESLDRAVIWLGKHAVSCLALSFTLSENANRGGTLDRYYKDFWLRSVIQALAMEWLAHRNQPGNQGPAFVVGLLMDLGQLALLQTHADVYVPVLDRGLQEQRPLREIEQEMLETTHVAISVDLLSSWSLPKGMVDIIRHHELEPAKLSFHEQDEHYSQICMANVASATGDFLSGLNPAGSFNRLQDLTARVYGFTEADLNEYLENIRARLNDTADLFSTDMSRLPSASDLLARAMEHLAQLSLRQRFETQDAGGLPDELMRENENLRWKVNELEKRTCIDSLTQVYSRDYFTARFIQRLRNVGQEVMVGVLFADIDKFKAFNDTYGHLAGDEVLRQVACTIRSCLRTGDVVARFGGEEFVVLLEQANLTHVKQVADRIRQSVAETRVPCGDRELSVTLSLGGIYGGFSATQNAGQLLNTLVAAADEAMYACKDRGGNSTEIRLLNVPDIMPSDPQMAAVSS